MKTWFESKLIRISADGLKTGASVSNIFTCSTQEAAKAAQTDSLMVFLAGLGWCRVPDELKRHCLLDENNLQYSTNLDRNRYGNDDQYLSTVIRFDLDFLHLCPCLVDVEIIDAKNGSGTILVSAGDDNCKCNHDSREVWALSPPPRLFRCTSSSSTGPPLWRVKLATAPVKCLTSWQLSTQDSLQLRH